VGTQESATQSSPQSSRVESSSSGAVLSDADRAAGWQMLFDGTDLSQWRGYRRQDLPAAWHVEGGTLAFAPTNVEASRGDLVTRDEYGDFELTLDWKVSPGGNSGIMYRVTEDAERTYETGPEYQVLDNTRHPDGKNPLTSAGADYGLYAPTADVTRPVGEWNAVRIVARGAHVEHWLNGQKVVEYELWSPDWEAKVKASKFAAWPGYGRARRGHIALQDHGNPVWFRNIRIRRLDTSTGS
jgi:hypothetical protein